MSLSMLWWHPGVLRRELERATYCLSCGKIDPSGEYAFSGSYPHNREPQAKRQPQQANAHLPPSSWVCLNCAHSEGRNRSARMEGSESGGSVGARFPLDCLLAVNQGGQPRPILTRNRQRMEGSGSGGSVSARFLLGCLLAVNGGGQPRPILVMPPCVPPSLLPSCLFSCHTRLPPDEW